MNDNQSEINALREMVRARDARIAELMARDEKIAKEFCALVEEVIRLRKTLFTNGLIDKISCWDRPLIASDPILLQQPWRPSETRTETKQGEKHGKDL